MKVFDIKDGLMNVSLKGFVNNADWLHTYIPEGWPEKNGFRREG